MFQGKLLHKTCKSVIWPPAEHVMEKKKIEEKYDITYNDCSEIVIH